MNDNLDVSQTLEQNGVMTAEKFSVEVETRVKEDGENGSYISATAQYFDELDIDAVDGLKLISKSLMDKIEHEASTLNLLKAKNTTSKIEF